MKKFLSCLFLLAVVAMYIVSTMGYGIHECKHDGSKDVIVLFGETPCEYVHSHLDSEGHVYTHAHNPEQHKKYIKQVSCGCGQCAVADAYVHTGECCRTTVFSVSSDQTIEDNANIAVPFFYIDFALCPLNLSFSFSQNSLFPVIGIKDDIPFTQRDLCISNCISRV